jgi:hypothetical protein
LAFNARQGIESQKTGRVKGNLAFSAQNVGVISLGSGLAAVGNYVFNDQPAQKEILTRLAALEKNVEFKLNQLLTVAQLEVYFINAMKSMQPDLGISMNQEKQKGQLAAVKRQEVKELAGAVFAKKKAR